LREYCSLLNHDFFSDGMLLLHLRVFQEFLEVRKKATQQRKVMVEREYNISTKRRVLPGTGSPA